MSIISLLVLLTFSICFAAMSAAYRGLSTPHVRHWARKGDATAAKLYPLRARGSAVLLTIELIHSIFLSAFVVLLSRTYYPPLAGLVVLVISFVGFIIVSELYLKPFGLRLLVWFSRALLALTHLLKPITLPLGRIFDRFIAEEPAVITKQELQDKLHSVEPADTDLTANEIRILRHTLSFGDKTVHDIMTPQGVVVSLAAHETLSPVVLDELHKSGHSRFPVLGPKKEVIGMLYVRDLIEIKTHALVQEVMHPKVYFVNEERELDHVLQAFLRTKQHMFMVVNAYAEIVGVITVEDVMEQILGKPIIDEFDKYDDMRAVAEARAKLHRKQNKENMVE
jgi:CBS domain containing-hemolysin-like protein